MMQPVGTFNNLSFDIKFWKKFGLKLDPVIFHFFINKAGMSSLFINLVLKTLDYLYLKIFDERT